MDSMSDKITSRVEEILSAKTEGREYFRRPLSRIEEILLNADFAGETNVNSDEILEIIRGNLTTFDIGAVPETRMINNKLLSDDITLTTSDIDAVPTIRTINGKVLSADVTLNASDVGAPDAVEQAEIDAEQGKKIDILTEILLGMDTTVIRTASGNPVEIDDGADNLPVKNLTVEIPVTQSGNGDPCLAGHGKNLIRSMPDSRVTADITYTVADDGSITANGTSTGNAIIDIPVFYLAAGNYILNGCPEGESNASTNSYTIIMQNNNGGIYGRNNGNDVSVTLPEDHKAFLRVLCRNGYTANNLVFRPMIRHADVTDGTWAPYVNIRPFAGTDSVTVTRTGKNLVPILRTNDATHGGTTAHMLGDGRYTLNGKHSSSAGVMGLNPINNFADEQDRLAEPLFVMKKGVTYYVSGCQFTYRSGNPHDETFMAQNAMHRSISSPLIVTPEADWYVKQIRIYFSANMEYNSGTIYEPMITSDSGKVWEPYQGQSVTVSTSDAGTVYGGNLNVTTGVLTVTHGHIAAYAGETVPDGWVSSTGELSDGAEIVYPLETPVTYQLTPQELKTLLGVNYITSDTGNITLKYHANASLLYQTLHANS